MDVQPTSSTSSPSSSPLLDSDSTSQKVDQLSTQHLTNTSSSTEPNSQQLSVSTLIKLLSYDGSDKLINFFINTYKLNMHHSDYEGNTLLHLAVKLGQLNFVKCLVKTWPAGIDVKNNYSFATLHLAVQYGLFQITKCLVKNKADVNVKTIDDETPLHLAIEYGYLKIAMFLVKKGNADVNVKNKFGDTSLHLAMYTGDLELVKCLVEGKADVKITNNNNDTPLHSAVMFRRLEIIKFLVKKTNASIHARGNRGFTPLHYAVYRGYIELVRWLVEEGKANIHITCDYYYFHSLRLHHITPLLIASCRKNFDIVQCLLPHLKEKIHLLILNDDKDTTLNLTSPFLQFVNVANCTKLNSLKIESRVLKDFPEIKDLTALTNLQITGCPLEGVPPLIGKLTSLRVLDLSNNCINKLPDEIGNLVNLTNFHLNDNQLKILPDSLAHLTQLKILTLYNNQLISAPRRLYRNKNLKIVLHKMSNSNGQGLNQERYDQLQTGNVKALQKLPYQVDKWTLLFQMVVHNILLEKGDQSRFTIKDNKITLLYPKGEIALHTLLSSVKWSLMLFEPNELSAFLTYPHALIKEDFNQAKTFCLNKSNGLLHLSEMVAINLYTREAPCRHFNSLLRGRWLSNENNAFSDKNIKEIVVGISAIASGLNRLPETPLPKKSGKQLYRLSFRNEPEKLKAGLLIKELAFSSTSHTRPAEGFWYGNNLVWIYEHGKHFAKDIAQFSDCPNERERLFLPGLTHFITTVIPCRKGDDTKYEIKLKHAYLSEKL